MLGQPAVREELPGGRVQDGRREHAPFFGAGGDDPGQRPGLPNRPELVGKEEPGPVLPVEQARDQDGASQGRAQLVALEFRLPLFEEVAGVQIVVPVEPVQVSMKLVAAALGHGGDLTAGTHAVLGRVEAGLHVEFLQRVGARLEGGVPVSVGEEGAVDIGEIVLEPHPHDLDVAPVRRRRGGPGRQAGQPPDVAGVDRQRVEFLLVDDLSQIRPSGSQQSRTRLLDRGAAGRPPPELEIRPEGLSHQQIQVPENLRPESRQRHGQLVLAHPQAVAPEIARRAGEKIDDLVRIQVSEADLGVRRRRSVRQQHPAQNCAGVDLGLQHNSGCQPEDRNRRQDSSDEIHDCQSALHHTRWCIRPRMNWRRLLAAVVLRTEKADPSLA